MCLIDLSHVINGLTPVYPGDSAVRLEPCRTAESDGYTAYLLQTGLHAGTHIEVPMHLTDDERMIAHFPPDCFVGPGVLLDVRGENPIEMWPHYREQIRPGCAVLLWTGWDKQYGTSEYYTQHPAVNPELAVFLIETGVRLLGMDMPAPDHVPFALHKELLRGGVMVLENLTSLQALDGLPDFDVLALPLKIEAEASLVRAVAMV